ncbi:MAG: PGPGW domain-containing protein [Gaiella sp.]
MMRVVSVALFEAPDDLDSLEGRAMGRVDRIALAPGIENHRGRLRSRESAMNPIRSITPLKKVEERLSNMTVRTVRRIVIGIAGATVVAIGIAMLILPGPGLVVIGVGLGLLSIEFAFAQRWLRIVKEKSSKAAERAGIPKPLRRIIIIVGLGLSVLFMFLPGFIVVVRTPGGYEVIRRPGFGYAHAWTSIEALERARATGDEGAALLLQSLEQRASSAPREEKKP